MSAKIWDYPMMCYLLRCSNTYYNLLSAKVLVGFITSLINFSVLHYYSLGVTSSQLAATVLLAWALEVVYLQ